MSRAVICQPNGEIVKLDLGRATPDEAAVAIFDHNELELVRALMRASQNSEETSHVVD